MDYLDPQHFLDLLHYKIGYKLYTFLQNKGHPHIILYGVSNSGKSILIKTIMKDRYPGELVKQKNESFSFSLHNHYYLFNCSYIIDKVAFIDYIQNLIQTYDYYNNTSKYIILDKFEKMNVSMQNILKVILEKSYYTCKFIIITNQYNHILQSSYYHHRNYKSIVVLLLSHYQLDLEHNLLMFHLLNFLHHF